MELHKGPWPRALKILKPPLPFARCPLSTAFCLRTTLQRRRPHVPWPQISLFAPLLFRRGVVLLLRRLLRAHAHAHARSPLPLARPRPTSQVLRSTFQPSPAQHRAISSAARLPPLHHHHHHSLAIIVTRLPVSAQPRRPSKALTGLGAPVHSSSPDPRGNQRHPMLL